MTQKKTIRALAITQTHKGRASRIVTPVRISAPSKVADFKGATQYRALWDTGATGSVITPQVARDLGLIATGQSAHTGINGVSTSNTYVIDLYLAEGLRISTTAAEAGEHDLGFDVIIGMNIISMGDFAVTSLNGLTTMSYRYPSLQTIDFGQSSKPPITQRRFGRNEPCHCGSGKKYKYCHGK